MLKAIFYWLRPDLRVFGRKWSAEEIKRLYLSLRDMVIEKELKVCNHFIFFPFHLSSFDCSTDLFFNCAKFPGVEQ
jgi:hypothetical protein